MLKKVNVVLHPVENPDGAAMAYELQKLTPTHMLHAGRYSALGMDVASQVGLPDPLLPESLVRGKVWRDWLPDIYLNPHGYPSHEWVQQFAGYVPPGFRSYWSSRGWWTQMSALRDPRYPEHARVAETHPRADRARSEQLSGRARDEPAASGALPALGLRLRALRVQPGDLQGYGDLLHRSGERPAASARAAPARASAAAMAARDAT